MIRGGGTEVIERERETERRAVGTYGIRRVRGGGSSVVSVLEPRLKGLPRR